MSRALPERRAEQITATILFVDVLGFSRLSDEVGTERAYLAVTELLRLLDGVARKHGGSVDKYQGDKLMAVFGYPLPVENAARAAAFAALEMRERIAAFGIDREPPTPFESRMGLNTGALVAGDIRGPVVREFHVLGDAVNVSARLNAKAPTGEIWAGQRTFEQAGEAFAWRTLEPLRLKGKSEPVQAFALESARSRTRSGRLGFDERVVCELVARDTELERLREGLDRLRQGHAGAALIRGEGEAGKSRLLAALGETGPLTGIRVLQGQGALATRDRPFAALAPWLDELAAGGDAGLAARGSADELERLEQAILAAARETPTLIVVEDLQWLDAGSERLLQRLPGQAVDLPLLLICSARPGAAADRMAAAMEILPADRALQIELDPLDRSDAERLVRAATGSRIDETSLALVLERGGRLPGPLLQAAFLAPALRSQQEQDQTREGRTSEAERRHAVVVSADLSGFTAMTEKIGAERAYPVVASCLGILDEVARTYGGTVDHYLGDCVIALFGVPRALEDAPRAALNAAIEMRQRVRAFSRSHDLAVPIDVHIGVATGMGIAGDISGPLIREFAVMGDHVDRADRLTHDALAGEIRVDEATHRAVADVFDFEEARSRSDVTETPITTHTTSPGDRASDRDWNLLSTAPRRHRAQRARDKRIFSRLVGREHELATLHGVLDELAAGQGRIVSLIAEAGVGKSRLLDELREGDDRAVWLEGRSISNGRNIGYHPIADLLRGWSGIDDDDHEASSRRKLDDLVAELVPERAGELAPLLAVLLGVDLTVEERARMASTQGDALEKLLRSAILQLLRAACKQRPIVISMEDLHWADLSSVELLESLLRLSEEGPILFLNAFRPGFQDTSERIRGFAQEQLAHRHVGLELQALDARAARALVKNLFRGGDVPQTTRAAIEQRARGNPFFMEEIVRSLLDAGALIQRDGSLQSTAALASVEIPNTVHEAVLARVDRLDLERRAVIQAASVIGQIFHRDVVEAVLEPFEGLDDLLSALEASEFIEPTDRVAGVEYTFKHPLIQEVTYGSMLESRARALHREVARAAEARLPEGMPGHAAMLAFHYTKGGDVERADVYLSRAGDEAARSAASNEALHFFQEASALYESLHGDRQDPERRAALEKNLAIALLNRGRLLEAVHHFDRCSDLLGAPAPREPIPMALSFLTSLTSVMSRVYLRRRPYGRSPSTARDRELVDVMFRRAMAQSTSAPTRFLVDSIALIDRFSRIDPHSVPETAAIYSGVIAIFSYGGLSFGVGRRFLEIASGLAREGAVEERVLYYRTLRFLHHLLEGDWSDEHEIEIEAVDEGLRDGRFWEACTYLNLDGVRKLYQGRFDEARARIAKLAEVADLYEHDLAASAQHALTAYLHVERRELEPALEALETYYDEHAEATFNLLALGTRAKVYCLMGEPARAEQSLVRAEAILSEAGRVAPYHASSVRSARYLADLMALERVVADGSRPGRALRRRVRRSREAALATAQKVAFRRPEALRLAGHEAWLCKHPRQALGWWQRAYDCSVALGARPECGRTLAVAGLALRDGMPGRLAGRSAASCLGEAESIFQELDLALDRSKLAQVL